MTIKSRMEYRLTEAFSPERLEVVNESHLHAGHQPGFDGEGETHMRIRIVSAQFAGKTRIARHRMVNDLVKEEFDAGLHALAIEAAAPGEPVRW
ncbi:BolA family transcriptional regulator [Rhizobium sp. TRM96647]|uniref:BolA family protein n=1 Tax=unclassified Rhizobium TaxID=2613769 RepID=UPI001E53BEF0|nr:MULTISPECIES: BolA family protein [unclassified Rhizobium]MCD2182322.1 BolA family transcriptional regulator [Rhizobium sp. GN54]MCV3734652.1 BolA family transcriptional regulator [Rhizobium sp. TRM96647]MCV3757022.1 BolA family transcriptional regulator [Rhizobium sp. TRM96650]